MITFNLTKIKLGKGERMLRVGFGEFRENYFFRIDLWNKGYRISW